jgi:methionine-rich copper-binding protein CopC
MSRSLAFSMLLLTCSSPQAMAHASLLQAVPEPGAVVAAGDVPIELRFDSRLDPRFSNVELLKAGSEATAALSLQAAESQNLLKAKATGLEEGPYVLRWRVLSVDGHANQGEIKFRIGR